MLGPIDDWPSVLEVRFEDATLDPALTGLCAGYDQKAWRAKELVDDLLNWLPEFALKPEEFKNLNSTNMIRLLRLAFSNLYKTKKYEKRGELGELMLYAVLRRFRKSVPAINKIFFKDGPNETVKGFDAVHVVRAADGLELWLGEVKLYDNISKAIASVVPEMNQHVDGAYLRSEFVAITNKIDAGWEHANELKRLLDPTVSLDTIFKRICVPVLLTYDSHVLTQHDKVTDAFRAAFEAEVRAHHKTFLGKGLPKEVRIELFLVPLCTKKSIIDVFDTKLKNLQAL